MLRFVNPCVNPLSRSNPLDKNKPFLRDKMHNPINSAQFLSKVCGNVSERQICAYVIFVKISPDTKAAGLRA